MSLRTKFETRELPEGVIGTILLQVPDTVQWVGNPKCERDEALTVEIGPTWHGNTSPLINCTVHILPSADAASDRWKEVGEVVVDGTQRFVYVEFPWKGRVTVVPTGQSHMEWSFQEGGPIDISEYQVLSFEDVDPELDFDYEVLIPEGMFPPTDKPWPKGMPRSGTKSTKRVVEMTHLGDPELDLLRDLGVDVVYKPREESTLSA